PESVERAVDPTAHKGRQLITEMLYNAPSAKWRAQTPRDARAQSGFRPTTGDIHPAVDQPVNECTDDLGAIEHLAAFSADVRREPIEVDNLSIEKHHRYFRPSFIVYRRTASAGSCDLARSACIAFDHRRHLPKIIAMGCC